MKSIIISDIYSKFESIIPFALHFSKQLWDKTTVIHAVDPRKHQAVSSAYADSQTFEVGRKLTHDEILGREIHEAHHKLDDLLSREASRLNFPMRVNVKVLDSTLGDLLEIEAGNYPDALIIVSSEPDGHIFEHFAEVLELAGNFKNLVLVIPPGLKFTESRKTFVFYDFNSYAYHSVLPVMDLLMPLKPALTVADVDAEGKYLEMEMQRQAWQEVVKKLIEPGVRLSSTILTGKDHARTVAGYAQRNGYSLAALPHCNGKGGPGKKYSQKTILQLIGEIGIPVLLYPC